jgi:hypothetical protein
MGQRLCGAPVLREHLESNRIVWPAPQGCLRDRHERVQVERADPAAADPGEGQIVAARRENGKIFFRATTGELPENHSGPSRRRAERRHGSGPSGDRQAVLQAVGMGQAQWAAAARFRRC